MSEEDKPFMSDMEIVCNYFGIKNQVVFFKAATRDETECKTNYSPVIINSITTFSRLTHRSIHKMSVECGKMLVSIVQVIDIKQVANERYHVIISN